MLKGSVLGIFLVPHLSCCDRNHWGICFLNVRLQSLRRAHLVWHREHKPHLVWQIENISRDVSHNTFVDPWYLRANSIVQITYMQGYLETASHGNVSSVNYVIRS